jgi:hypothetical protein
MQPPWEALSHIPPGSIGWRMGPGEDYLEEFWSWFDNLTDLERAMFQFQHPEPRGWRGFYAGRLEDPFEQS